MSLSPLEEFVRASASSIRHIPSGWPMPYSIPGAGRPTYGDLEPEQALALKPFIRGRRLRDYGCGNLVLDAHLLKLGARHIEAIDMHNVRVPPVLKHRLQFIHGGFISAPPSMRTAVISWPYNVYNGLEFVIEKAPMVVYIGRNTGGTVCGYPVLWLQLLKREVLLYSPHEHNTLIVYGEFLKRRRRAVPEEYAALRVDEPVSYYEAHRKKSWDLPKKWKHR